MSLVKQGRGDNIIRRCPFHNSEKRSVFDGSIFSNSKFTSTKMLELLYTWVCDYDNRFTVRELEHRRKLVCYLPQPVSTVPRWHGEAWWPRQDCRDWPGVLSFRSINEERRSQERRSGTSPSWSEISEVFAPLPSFPSATCRT